MGSSDWLYLLMEVVAVILLGVAILYGIRATRRPNEPARRESEEATREVYREEEQARQRREE